jgi:hypothetical protein
MREYGIITHKIIFYVPNSSELMNLVLKQMHNVPYVGHPGDIKQL